MNFSSSSRRRPGTSFGSAQTTHFTAKARPIASLPCSPRSLCTRRSSIAGSTGPSRKMFGQQITALGDRLAEGLRRQVVFNPLHEIIHQCVPGAERDPVVDSLVGQYLHAPLQQGSHDQDSRPFARLVQAVFVERQFGAPAHLEGHPPLRSAALSKGGDGTCSIAQSIGEYYAQHDPGRMSSLPCLLS